MQRRTFLKKSTFGTAALSFMSLSSGCAKKSETQKPNIVLILTDDQGYADVGVYGAEGFQTPNLDRMAKEGMLFTDFYVSAPICSPTRASLMTGCYPQRLGIPSVLGNHTYEGINPDEKLLPEILKEQGYRTALFGKWHLGHRKPFLPPNHGFDEFFGTPYSNDMGPVFDLKSRREGKTGLPLIEGVEPIEINPDQRLLTTRYTERSVKFIRENKDQPFFLYLAHNMPHTPLFVSDKFKGKSERGLYGDVIMEIDWSVGQILDALKENGLDENTLVVFVSDNGPWLIFGNHGGSADPLRGGKKQTLEGGMRVPCIMRWPKTIPANSVNSELITIMDILPTVTHLVGGILPENKIDGHNIYPLMTGKSEKTPYEVFYYYYKDKLCAVRSGKWKLQLPHIDQEVPDPDHIGMDGYRGKVMSEKRELALFDMENDVEEIKDLSAKHPEIVKRLQHFAELARRDLGDSVTDVKGMNVRPPGILEE